jgi:hypothetical protein
MREQMIASCDAVLALGGKQAGYGGKYPGIVEEAYLALRYDKPLFLLGGFGGSVRVLIEVLRGENLGALSAGAPARDPQENQFVEFYNQRVLSDPQLGQEPIDYGNLNHFFATRGVDGLKNGLNADENSRLFATVYLDEAIFLLLTGLKRLFKGGRAAGLQVGPRDP